ncbi:MAG: GAF domain-containing protein [Salinivirgaceae bacterium]|nr:GAF domain-containing protein [Salinivirgaceae bacterium]
MKFRLRLSIRMLIFIVSTASIAFFVTLKIIGENFKEAAFAETMETTNNQAKKYASIIKTSLEDDFNKIRTYAQMVEESEVLTIRDRRNVYNKTLEKIIYENKDYTAVWDSWELRFEQENYTLPYGRVSRSFYYTAEGDVRLKVDSLDKHGDNYESLYFMYKLVPEEAITNPYFYSYTKAKVDEILESSLIIPLLVNNEFAGLAGIDLKMEHFQSVIDSINKEQDFDVMLFSFNGDVVAHPNKLFIGQNIVEIDTFLTNKHAIIDKIQSGESSHFMLEDSFGNDSIYFTISSFKIGNTYTPWAILITAPLSIIETQINTTFAFGNKVAWFGIILLSLVVFIFTFRMVLPLRKTRNILSKLALGNVHNIERLNVKATDEIGEMTQSLNTVIDGLEKVTEFAENIGEGNYNYEFKKLSDKDNLGTAIIEMRNSLKKAKIEENKRKEEEEHQEWTSKGINIFNKVLRIDNHNLHELTYEIIQTLTVYLGAHMGGIYLKSDLNKNEFELISFLGFAKTKFEKKNIMAGEGVVGRCILEKETIFMNDIPSDYNRIISGLGSTVPVTILVVPLISNRILIGVLEIESLKQIRPYQISFVEKIAETIASTVSTVKTNETTTQLLDKSQKQAEELEQQEEEMRQNMEEMQATQEEASKREGEIISMIDAIDQLMPVIEYDRSGKIIDVNDSYLKIYKTRKSQLVGKQHKAELFLNETETAKHNLFWSNLNEGIEQESIEYIKSGKDDYWMLEKFLPIKDNYGLVQKILCIGIDITDQKKIESAITERKEKGSLKSDNDKNSQVKKKTGPSVNLNQELTFIDLTYLKMVYKKDSSRIYNILKLYYETLPEQISEINEIAKMRDFVKLKSKISSLKTKMSYLGLKNIFESLRGIENMLVEQRNLSEIPTVLNSILKLWAEAEAELRNLLGISI